MTRAHASSHQWKASAISVLVHASVALAIGLMASHAPRTATMKTIDLGLLEQIASAPAPEPMPRNTSKPPPSAPKPVVKQSPPPEPIAEPIPEPMPAEVVEEALPVEPVDTQSLPEVTAAPLGQDDQVTSQEPSDALAKGPTSRPHHDPGPSDWDLRMINERIRAGLTYPAIARRMGWEGTVRVAFVICCDGTVRNVEIVESSGSAVLDKSALKVIEGFLPFPGRAREARVVVPIVYDLRDAG